MVKPPPLNYTVIKEARRVCNDIMNEHGLAVKFYVVLFPRKLEHSYGQSIPMPLLHKNTMITALNQNYVEELFPFHTTGISRQLLMRKIRKRNWVNGDELVFLLSYTMLHEMGHCIVQTVERTYNSSYAFVDDATARVAEKTLKDVYESFPYSEEWASNFAEYMLNTGRASDEELVKRVIRLFKLARMPPQEDARTLREDLNEWLSGIGHKGLTFKEIRSKWYNRD